MKLRSIAVVLVLVLPSIVAAAETGDLWETKVEMTMAGAQGFALPSTTSTVCRPQGTWTEPPAPPSEQQCTMSDVERSTTTMSWTVRCTNPPATGTGQIEFEGAAAFHGTVTMSAEGHEMVMKLAGRRVGTCDLAAQNDSVGRARKQMAAAQAQQAEMMTKSCAEGASAGYAMFFVGPGAMCTEPAQKAAFCATLTTEKGYAAVHAGASMGVSAEDAIRFCGKEPDTLRLEVCASALAAGSFDFVFANCPELASDACAKAMAAEKFDVVLANCPELASDACAKAVAAEKFDIVAKHCPAETQEIAKRECAGRQYTSTAGSKYYPLCVAYAQTEIEQQQQAADPASEEKKGAVNKAKKGLKGLLGR